MGVCTHIMSLPIPIYPGNTLGTHEHLTMSSASTGENLIRAFQNITTHHGAEYIILRARVRVRVMSETPDPLHACLLQAKPCLDPHVVGIFTMFNFHYT